MMSTTPAELQSQDPSSQLSTNNTDMLTYAIQKVGFEPDQTAPQVPTDLNGFMQAIDEFPWAAQHSEWDELQDGPLPSVGLINVPEQRELWVTALSDDLDDDYVVISVAMRMHKGLFSKPKPRLTNTLVDVEGRALVNKLCELFARNEYEALDKEIARLE